MPDQRPERRPGAGGLVASGARPSPGALPLGQVLLVSGSANWQRQDRYLPTEGIEPLQVVNESGVTPCPAFGVFRNVGVSCIVPLPDGESVVFTTGADLVRLWPSRGRTERVHVEGLRDVHELTVEAESLLVANTGNDEVVELDLDDLSVRRRISVSGFRASSARPLFGHGLESFHLNQAFADRSGRVMGLVHHTGGFRLFSHAQRKLTGHGSGGIIDVERGWRRDLRLHAPHSIRRWGDGWIVLNSGRGELIELAHDFSPTGIVPLHGWPRGIAVPSDESGAFVGISGIRRRYARPGDSTWTGLAALSREHGGAWSLELTRIEQVNAVHLCSVALAEALINLPSIP